MTSYHVPIIVTATTYTKDIFSAVMSHMFYPIARYVWSLNKKYQEEVGNAEESCTNTYSIVVPLYTSIHGTCCQEFVSFLDGCPL